jgi:hypothetical protein
MSDAPPPDFDWVTRRAKCSAEFMFGVLRRLAQENILRRNALTGPHEAAERFMFEEHEGRCHFAVYEPTTMGSRKAVDFRLEDDVIYVKPSTGHSFEATLMLDTNGRCKFKVGGDELDSWQVLKLGLESLFFGRA